MIGPYKLLKTLGTGATGKVKLAINTETEKQVAIKIMSKQLIFETEKARINAQKEIAVLKLLNHPSVLKVFDVFESDDYLFIVMEYMPGGELFDFLVNQEFISSAQSLIIFQQLIYALEYCHNHLVCHRDLKPENLLLDSFGNIKIADFGMAGLINERHLLETSCGSPHYAAPEVIEGIEYDGTKSDIWSCGVILYGLLTGKLPFDGESIKDVLLKVVDAKYTIPENLSPEKKELIKGMLEKDVNKRFTIEQIKQNEWFRSNFPTNYKPPQAILRKKLIQSVPENEINEFVVGNLSTLGFDQQHILRSLISEQPNLEKIMYTLYMRKLKKSQKTEKQQVDFQKVDSQKVDSQKENSDKLSEKSSDFSKSTSFDDSEKQKQKEEKQKKVELEKSQKKLEKQKKQQEKQKKLEEQQKQKEEKQKKVEFEKQKKEEQKKEEKQEKQKQKEEKQKKEELEKQKKKEEKQKKVELDKSQKELEKQKKQQEKQKKEELEKQKKQEKKQKVGLQKSQKELEKSQKENSDKKSEKSTGFTKSTSSDNSEKQKQKEEKQKKVEFEKQKKKEEKQKKVELEKQKKQEEKQKKLQEKQKKQEEKKIKMSIKKKKKNEQFDLSFDIEKESKTTKKSWFGKVFKRKSKKMEVQEGKKYQKLHLDNKFEQGGEVILENPTEQLAKNYYVSFSINQPIMEIMRNFQEGLTKLNFNWAYPNIFTIKANLNKTKFRVKIQKCPILNTEPIKVYLISKRGTAQEFIEFCNSLIKVSNF
ncbi:serine/threonine-protein kinase brsk2 [Anaeramoeba ignava]|uniref:Serine/threonine-protein kinase brsk2 n=1 Tax=Anaeramoeba ignava TaxID=1746090 RepID=A0A9Q0RBE0_ANAIG|nr:serine/threonine-protein kinase brsk2 [Anaeramoeba ignava]